MTRTAAGQSVLAVALLAGGGVFVALGLWDRSSSPERARFVRLGVVWALFGVVQIATATEWYRARADRRGSGRSRVRTGLLGAGAALVLVGFVLSGTYLPAFGAAGLLLVAVAGLAGYR